MAWLMGNRNHNFLLALATNFLWAAFLTATAATTTTLCVSLVYTGDLSFTRNQIQRMQKSNHQMCFATIAEVKQQKSIALEKYTSNNWNRKFKASARAYEIEDENPMCEPSEVCVYPNAAGFNYLMMSKVNQGKKWYLPFDKSAPSQFQIETM